MLYCKMDKEGWGIYLLMIEFLPFFSLRKSLSHNYIKTKTNKYGVSVLLVQNEGMKICKIGTLEKRLKFKNKIYFLMINFLNIV